MSASHCSYRSAPATVSLSKIKKYNTNNNIQRLKADRKFRALLTPFNIVVWNGSRHPECLSCLAQEK